ncbi:MAG: cob(I)yrinic acid a,c-diamide adenosyltransferase [Candidatus Omnitrophica bacterium]|jgi:cob(I)alamin adenosyltransferase|nr:cob(I)yrinic acid a,c-diamide adenosyltransferase [Candidatus Omnitrophota bacterium]
MSITTKTGDNGKTSLLFGERASKSDLRVKAIGTLDELCSFMGLSKSLLRDKGVKKIIEDIQRDLFIIGAETATLPKYLYKLEKRIDKRFVLKLDELLRQWENKNKFKSRCFYLPGENIISSSFDVSRAVARRAERELVTLEGKKGIKNPDMLIYLNRLSDLLYLFARNYENKPKRK